MPDGPTASDALQVAQRALAKVNELEREQDELTEDLDDALEELTALRLRVQERDEDRPYESLSVDERVGMVREHGFRKAADSHGAATLDYDDIRWEVFDGKASPSYCYKLMRLAAGLTDVDDKNDRPTGGKIPGFRCRDPGEGNYHLAVDAEAAKRSTAFSSEKKEASAEGGSR